jgi:hypothetical protein
MKRLLLQCMLSALFIAVFAPQSNGQSNGFKLNQNPFGLDKISKDLTDVEKTNSHKHSADQIVQRDCSPTPPPNTVWGANPGEGDFDEGMNGWITDNELAWVWLPPDGFPMGAAAFNLDVMNSPTRCNGGMAFDSDWLDNNGNPGTEGQGLCPSPCSGSLISPKIDLSGQEIEGLYLEFFQGVIHWYESEYYILISIDDGISWQDTIPINTQFVFPNQIIEETLRIPLCGLSGSELSEIRIRFDHVGNYYFWYLDDIFLINEASADPAINNTSYAVAPNYKTPESQVVNAPVLAQFRNRGNITADSANIAFQIIDESNQEVVYSDSELLNDIAGCTDAEFSIFENMHPMASREGSYLLQYTAAATDNADIDNDQQLARMLITKGTFGKLATEAELGAQYLRTITHLLNWNVVAGGSRYFTAGTEYYVPNGSAFKATKIRFGLDQNIPVPFTGIITANLYKYFGDLNENNLVDGSERDLIAMGIHTVTHPHTETDRIVEVELSPVLPDQEIIQLEDDQSYLVLLECSPSTTDGPIAPLLALSVISTNNPVLKNFDYRAVNFAYNQMGIARKNTLIGGGLNILDVDDRRLREVDWKTMFLELDIEPLSTSTDEHEIHSMFSIFPNPANDYLIVDFGDLPTNRELQLEIFRTDGKRVLMHKMAKNTFGLQRLNISSLTNGIYILSLHNESFINTQKLIIQKN